MPPRITSSRSLSCGMSAVVCEQYFVERPLVLVERMAGEIEAEHFLFLLGSLAVGPFVEVRAASAAGLAAARRRRAAEQGLLAALAVGGQRRAGLHGPLDDRVQAATACAPKQSNAPALMSVSIVARLAPAASTRSQKSNRSLNGPPLVAGGDDRLARAAAAAFDRRQAELNLAVGDGEIDARAVHVGRHDVDAHPLAIFQVLDERVLRLESCGPGYRPRAAPP